MACVVLSGSPVAAIALTLLASRTLTTAEAFAMIGGSRLGASFVVLVIGFWTTCATGAPRSAAPTSAWPRSSPPPSIYVPALALGSSALQRGLFAGLRLEGRDLASFVAAVYGPLTGLARHLPRFLLFVRRGLLPARRLQALRPGAARPAREARARCRWPAAWPTGPGSCSRSAWRHRPDAFGLGVPVAARPAGRQGLRAARERLPLHPGCQHHDLHRHPVRGRPRGPSRRGAHRGGADDLRHRPLPARRLPRSLPVRAAGGPRRAGGPPRSTRSLVVFVVVAAPGSDAL